MEAAGPDVLGGFVHLSGESGDFEEGVVGENQLDAFCFHQGDVLLGESVLRFFQDADKVIHRKRFQFHANGEAALEFGDEVAGLRHVESPGRDEENVVGADEAVAGVDCGAFHDGQNVALHTFPADIGTVSAFAAGYFIDFIEEDDAV